MAITHDTPSRTVPLDAVRHIVDTTSIDLGALDGVIATHLFACRPELLGSRFSLNRELRSTASEAAFHILFEDALAVYSVGDREYCVLQALEDGFQLALDLAALVSKSPLMPNKAAISDLLAEANAKMAGTLEHVGRGERKPDRDDWTALRRPQKAGDHGTE